MYLTPFYISIWISICIQLFSTGLPLSSSASNTSLRVRLEVRTEVIRFLERRNLIAVIYRVEQKSQNIGDFSVRLQGYSILFTGQREIQMYLRWTFLPVRLPIQGMTYPGS
jgi:hypothetical protein